MKKPLVGLYSFVVFFWVVTSSSLNPVSSDPCHIDAWVRAPDLDPGQIIPGQVRIKANGTCDPVSEYSLILRFKERAWAKLPKPDIALPQRPDRNYIYGNISKIDRNSVFRSSNSFFFRHSDPLWGKYTEDISDPSLWDVIEEERIAFESRYRLNEDITSFSLGKGLTHDFALLVPTTNYPPALLRDNYPMTPINKSDTAEKGDEYIYLYTVEIRFDNGTTIEVPAGYTTFKPTGLNANPGPEVITANLTQSFTSSDNLNVSLNINVTFPNGRTLEQGSTSNLTFTLCDWTLVSSNAYTNYSLALHPPSMHIQTSTHDRWIQTLSPMNNYTMSSRFATCQLSPAFSSSEQADLCGILLRARNLRNKEDISSWNLSTSKSLQVAPKAFPSFETHYRSFESKLIISFNIYLQEIKDQTQMFDEDYYWIPTISDEKENKIFRSLGTQIPITISPNVKPSIPAIHYLSSHARQPLFIDQSTIEGLSQLSTEERDLLAPKSVPIIKSNTENVVRQRYRNKALYYVGDTWHRKVLNGVSQSDLSERDSSLNTLLVQVPKD